MVLQAHRGFSVCSKIHLSREMEGSLILEIYLYFLDEKKKHMFKGYQLLSGLLLDF